MRILPYTEIDDFENKVRCLTGGFVVFETQDGNAVSATIANGGFYINSTANIEDTKTCLYLLSEILNLEYKGVK